MDILKNLPIEFDQLDILRSRGYVVLEDLVPVVEIDRLNGELAPWFDRTPTCQGDFYGWETTRFGSILTKGPTSRQLALNPEILAIMDAVLGPYCDWFQLNLSQAVRIHPGAVQQPPHRDEEMWPGPKHGECLLNVMWALDDFTPENGATLIWPGSQFSPHVREHDSAEADIATMKKGSAVIFLGSVAHCGGTNTSNVHRTGLIFSYCLGWLKQYENQFLAYPPDVAKDFSKELQDLIGYRIHRPNLGGYENHCPSVLLEDEPPEVLPAIDAFPPDIEQMIEEWRQQAAA